MNEWASQEGRASFSQRSRVSRFAPDPFSHPMVRVLGYLWRLALVALLALGVYAVLFRSHLGSEEFAATLAGHAQRALGADSAQLNPLDWSGGQASSRKFSATGGDGAAFRTLEALDVSFRVPLSMYRQPEWRLSRVEASSLQVELRSGTLHLDTSAWRGAAQEEPTDPSITPAVTPPVDALRLEAGTPDPALIPEDKPRDRRVLDLDLRKDGFRAAPAVQSLHFGGVDAARFHVTWGVAATTRGELREASLSARRGADGAWTIEVPAGVLSQNWLRDMQISNLRARLADGVLTLEDTPVQVHSVAAVLSGRVQCSEVPEFELALKGENFPLEQFFGEPFDRMISLLASGTLKIGGSTNLASGITIEANLQATGGSIRDLAIQHALANTTTRIRFRDFAITSGTIEFATGGGRLHVKSFSLASRADVALRGAFIYGKGGFTGDLEIGADPALLQKLAPAVLDKFFPKSEGGKRWLVTPLNGEYDKLTSEIARELTAAHEASGRP